MAARWCSSPPRGVRFLPARAGDAREAVEGPLDGIASLTFAEAEGVLERDAAEERGDLDPADGGGHGRAEVPLERAPGVSCAVRPLSADSTAPWVLRFSSSPRS